LLNSTIFKENWKNSKNSIFYTKMFLKKQKKYLRKKTDLLHDYMIFGLFLAGGYLFYKAINRKMVSEDDQARKKTGFSS